LTGNIPDVPNPNNLMPGASTLCPNSLSPTPNAEWDVGTGITPWYRDCTRLPEEIYADGFDGP
jgi:hypothetical protein